ncbi:MAG: transporter, partial [Candidatus Omnitrophica bacterium]|nr:transporter [Candidatus Omnitrophota bacterium]
QFNTEDNNFEFGDVLKYNLAYQKRILPQVLPERGVYSQVNLVLEFNGEYAQKDKSGGSIIEDSGGNTLFISPGIQWVTKRWILETSIQLPVIQDLNGSQIETDYIAVTSLRLTF